jgi:hypothetical protein
MSSFNLTKTDKRGQIMGIPIYWDENGYDVQIGTIVGYTEGWCLSVESEIPEIWDFVGEVIALDDESGELGVLEITDKSGEWSDFRPNYAIPVQWEWNFRKYTAI